MNMGKRIELAKLNAERTFREKGDQASDPTMMTPEKLGELLDRIEAYEGKTLDMAKAQRFRQLVERAFWLYSNSTSVPAYEAEKISASHPHAIVWIEIKRLTALKGDAAKAFAAMSELADDIFFSGIKDDVIRITFSVLSVWKEPF